MGRLSTLNDRDIYAATGQQLALSGTVTLKDIVNLTGCSVGSLYHRFGSREGLLANAWLDAAKSFQSQFLNALQSGSAQAGLEAALATPRFCRSERERAIILACCRKSEFLNDATPTALKTEIQQLNKLSESALRAYATQNGYSLESCLLGIIAFPLGAVRMYLPTREIPISLDEKITKTFNVTVSA